MRNGGEMEITMEEAVRGLREELDENKLTCIAAGEDAAYTHQSRGVKPVIDFWSREYLKDAIIVDRVIGKASALFMADANPKHIHGVVMSQLAVEFLEKEGISYSADKVVPKIINRAGDGLCPMESAVAEVADRMEGIDILLEKNKN